MLSSIYLHQTHTGKTLHAVQGALLGVQARLPGFLRRGESRNEQARDKSYHRSPRLHKDRLFEERYLE